jgi:predicted signal transduction protein with EAL and GGDEF domain
VPPVEFIPIAEDSGIILQIGEWVLRTACREAATWARPLTIAVNVSAVQIHNASFAQVVHEILFETGLAPARLELEVTETALVRDLNRALATLRRIKILGVRIAMDDFGTGHSSLSNLRAFPFDKIKIDASFIKSVNGRDRSFGARSRPGASSPGARRRGGDGRRAGVPSKRALRRGAGLSARKAGRYCGLPAPDPRRRRRTGGAEPRTRHPCRSCPGHRRCETLGVIPAEAGTQ